MNEPVDKIINWFKHERRKYLNIQTIESYKVGSKISKIYLKFFQETQDFHQRRGNCA